MSAATAESLPVPPRRRSRLKLFLFALAPLVMLAAGVETAARLGEWAMPQWRSLPLPEEKAGILVPHPTLFWAPQPNFRRRYMEVNNGFKTNRWGQRSPNFEFEKPPGEFRILSLGESTTFGLWVTNDQTYSAQLERLLNERSTSTEESGVKYRVINCGVPAYSSFQSLLYLKTIGHTFRPDVVLFYHEANDYLPTSLRTSESTELGLQLSDRELYESNRATLERRLMAHCAAFRAVRYWFARREVAQMNVAAPADPLANIGMPGVPFTPRLADAHGRPQQGFDERQLPTRVRPEERRQNLLDLADYCAQRQIGLVIIHPAYADTQRHECVLTEVCREQKLNTFDAYDALHPTGQPGYEMFPVDGMHPSPEGHRRVAEGLAEFLRENELLAPAEK